MNSDENVMLSIVFIYNPADAQKIHDGDIFTEQKQLLQQYEVRHKHCFKNLTLDRYREFCVNFYKASWCLCLLLKSSFFQSRYHKAKDGSRLIPWVSIKTEVASQVSSFVQ